MMTLTRERVFEAAPMDPLYRENQQQLLEAYPFPEQWNKFFWRAWEHLIKWYRYECKEIGETRAFWRPVYRLIDNPTPDDIECIRGWVNLNWRLAEGFYPDPTKQPVAE